VGAISVASCISQNRCHRPYSVQQRACRQCCDADPARRRCDWVVVSHRWQNLGLKISLSSTVSPTRPLETVTCARYSNAHNFAEVESWTTQPLYPIRFDVVLRPESTSNLLSSVPRPLTFTFLDQLATG